MSGQFEPLRINALYNTESYNFKPFSECRFLTSGYASASDSHFTTGHPPQDIALAWKSFGDLYSLVFSKRRTGSSTVYAEVIALIEITKYCVLRWAPSLPSYENFGRFIVGLESHNHLITVRWIRDKTPNVYTPNPARPCHPPDYCTYFTVTLQLKK